MGRECVKALDLISAHCVLVWKDYAKLNEHVWLNVGQSKNLKIASQTPQSQLVPWPALPLSLFYLHHVD